MAADVSSQKPAGPATRPEVIPFRDAHRWIQPWYIAYAILGALVSGAAIILIPVVIVDNGGSPIQIGAAVALLNLGMLFAPFWGWFADRFRDYRGVFFGGFLLIAAGFALLAALHGPIAWYTGPLLIGFGAGASNTVAGLFVVEFTPEAEWAHRISWLQTFNALGVIAGTAFGGLLRPQMGLIASALLVLPALLVGRWGLPVPGSDKHLLRFGEFAPEHHASVVRRFEPLACSVMMRLFRARFSDATAIPATLCTPFGLLLISWFLFSLAVSAFSTLYPVLMRSQFHLSVAHASMLLSVATALSIPLYNYAGRVTTQRNPAHILALGVGVRSIVLLALGLLGLFRVPSAILPAILLFAAFQGIWPVISVASNDLAAELAPFGKGAAMGLFNAAAAVAAAVGAIAGGAMADRFGYSSASLLAAAGAALALTVITRVRVSPPPATA